MDPNDAPPSDDILNTADGEPAPTPTPPSDGAPSPVATGDGDPAPADPPVDKDSNPDAKSQTAGDVLSDDDDTAPEGVPDQYTFDAPEELGDFQLEEAKLDEFKAAAKDMGLTQDQFQKVVEYDLQRQQAAATEAVDSWNARVNGWREAAQSDKEFGGADYEANVKTAMNAVKQFADSEFKALLKSPSEDNPEGLAIGNHPAVLRFLNRIGKALADPKLMLGDDVSRPSDMDARLQRMYPSMHKSDAQ